MPNYYSTAFNGLSSYINCGSDASLDNLHANNFTIDLWIFAQSNVSISIVNKFALAGVGGWELYTDVDGTLWAYIAYTIKARSHAIEVLPTNAWAHLVMAFDKVATKKVYLAVNGQWCTYAVQQAYNFAIQSDAANPVKIGTSGAAEWVDGYISWLRISSGFRYPIGVNFTPPEQCVPPPIDATTVELWALDEGAGTTTDASIVHANQGTMINCAWNLDCTVSPGYESVPACETGVWIMDEDLAPTGNFVTEPVDIPFVAHEELVPTGNTYFMTPDTPQVADSDDDGPYSIWKKAGHG